MLAYHGGYQLPEVVIRLLRDAIYLRNIVATFINKEFPIKIVINPNINIGSNNVICNSDGGDIIINDLKILSAAQSTKYSVDRLIKGIDGNKISHVELSSKNEKVHITPDDRVILGQNREELNAEYNIIGKLDVVTFSSHRGEVISGNARFSVTWDESIRSKVKLFIDREDIIFLVKPIIDQKKLHLNPIAYHIRDCNELHDNTN